jgi:muramoyltetrapeptide carboxypeptidase
MLEDGLRYPASLTPGATIAVTAPSSGVAAHLHPRLDLALQHLHSQGFRIKEGQCLRQTIKSASASKEQRAREFMDFWLDETVDAIIPPWGGVFAMEVLPVLDWKALAHSKPKWVLGYSDISTVTFALSTRIGIATAHGTCLMEMLPSQTDRLTVECLRPLALKDGEFLRQDSGEYFQTGPSPQWDAPFQKSDHVVWKTLGNKPVRMKGRLIGGCLDTLSTLVGTPFVDPSRLKSKDGLIFYLENSDFGPADQYRYLWMMQQAGWFKHVNGFLIGRSGTKDETNPQYFRYQNLMEDFFGSLDIPFIYDCDIGHQQPNMTLINGALAEASADGQGPGFITQWRT